MKKSRTRKSKKPSLIFRNIVLSVLIIGAISYYAISRLPRPTAQPIGINEVTASPATVTLSLPSTITTSLDSDSAAGITVNTGGSHVSAIQVELTYDPSAITTPTIAIGDFLSVELAKPKVSSGKITFVLAAKPDSGGKSGSGTLATLKFRAKGNANSTLSFTSNTMVAATSSNSNALKSATGANIQVGSASVPANPPALTEVKPAPPLSSPKATSTPKKSTVSSSSAPTASARVFNPAGNLDYNKPLVAPTTPDVSENSTSNSTFARFLDWVKTIFGGK